MASIGHRKVGSSRTVNGFNESSSSVDWLGREMLEMRLRDKDKVDHDDERDIEPELVNGVGAEAGHVIRTIGGRNGQSRQAISYIAEHVVGTGSFGVVCQIKPHPWHKVFQKHLPPEAVDLVCRFFQYSPNLRCTALEACIHPFFDELRDPNTRLPNGRPLPPLFNFKVPELAGIPAEILRRLIPDHARKQNSFMALHA